MKINPYLYFNGNASEAIALYEKAFGGKAIVAKFKDAPHFDKAYTVPAGTEEYVMHARLNLGGEAIMFCDTPQISSPGEQVQLMIMFDSIDLLQKAFGVLKEGGTVTMEPQKTFWSECFGSVKDKFGVCWLLSYENEAQKAQAYGK